MNLFQNQQEHLENLCDIMKAYGKAYDTSPTGSGKTIVAIKLAKRLEVSFIVVIAPPTLCSNWENVCKIEKLKLVFMSMHAIRVEDILKQTERFMLVIDECQYFKNQCQRTNRLKRLTSSVKVQYTLFISAAPYDHLRQERNIADLFDVQNRSSMLMNYPSDLHCVLYYINQTTEEAKLYSKGYLSIRGAFTVDDANQPQFQPSVFMVGLRKIHNSLFDGLMRCVASTREKCPGKKLVISLKFLDHFHAFKEKFPESLILTGETPIKYRKEIISRFQEANMTYPILCLSDSIGGVGIDLDDQNGEFPRILITLPLFASDFLQLVGRIRRRRSKTDASVMVIQPPRIKTYFLHQMILKMKVLNKFIQDEALCIHNFKKITERHCDNCEVRMVDSIKILDSGSLNIIKEYVCSCPFLQSMMPE